MDFCPCAANDHTCGVDRTGYNVQTKSATRGNDDASLKVSEYAEADVSRGSTADRSNHIPAIREEGRYVDGAASIAGITGLATARGQQGRGSGMSWSRCNAQSGGGDLRNQRILSSGGGGNDGVTEGVEDDVGFPAGQLDRKTHV